MQVNYTFNDLPIVMSAILERLGHIEECVSLLLKDINTNVETHKPMTLHQVADYVHVPYSAIYQLVTSHQIPSLKIHGRYIVYRDELNKWLEKYRIATQELTPNEIKSFIQTISSSPITLEEEK